MGIQASPACLNTEPTCAGPSAFWWGINLLESDGKQTKRKHQKLWFWMSQHFHLTWPRRDFVTHPKRASDYLGLSLKFIASQKLKRFWVMQVQIFLEEYCTVKPFSFIFFYFCICLSPKQVHFLKWKLEPSVPAVDKIALPKVLFHFRKMNCCAGGVVSDRFQKFLSVFYFWFCLWTCCAFCPAVFSLHTKW